MNPFSDKPEPNCPCIIKVADSYFLMSSNEIIKWHEDPNYKPRPSLGIDRQLSDPKSCSWKYA